MLCSAFAVMATLALAAPSPMPPQPLTVELLDLNRGQWQFVDALGQYLHLGGPVIGAADGADGERVGVAYLCCDPEHPEDPRHASLRQAEPVEGAEANTFRVTEPFLSCTVTVGEPVDGLRRIEIRDIDLGPADYGDAYVSALYAVIDGHARPVWLLGGEDTVMRLTTDRVGHVFVAPETPRITLVTLPEASGPVRLCARDLATGRTVWRGRAEASTALGSVQRQRLEVPLQRYGVFEVTARASGIPEARLRICRVPRPRHITPQESRIGINIFQQQIWWYAYQVPMMADAGVHWIRPWLHWENAWAKQQPQPDVWDTRPLEAALRRTRAFGQHYVPILFFAPEWLSGTVQWSAPPQDKIDAWSRYVERLVRQFGRQVQYWEVWNEPDLMWPPETRDLGEHYVAVLRAAWDAAKRVDPNCTVLGLSHAGDEGWLQRVAAHGAEAYYDVATLHSYAGPPDIMRHIEERKAVLAAHGEGRPVWLNEFGATAYDFSPEYSERYDCSERSQAAALTSLYALALSVGDDAKAFWFCTYDPRDAAHESQWTRDAGIGVLYLGFLPKLSYAALAGVAHELDGRKCLGRATPAPGMQQVSFEGPVTVVWSDAPAPPSGIGATDLGCLSEEALVVRDAYTNVISRGRAGDIMLPLAEGPLYIEGSRQLAAIARVESEVGLSAGMVEALPGGTTVLLTAPRESEVSLPMVPDSVDARMVRGPGDEWRLTLTKPPAANRASGLLSLRVTVPKGAGGLGASHTVERRLAWYCGAPNLVRDGAFAAGGTTAWLPEPPMAVTWDHEVGHDVPGALRLDGPTERRLVHWGIEPRPGRGLQLSAWARLDCEGAVATVHLAFFGPEGWLGTRDLATLGHTGEAWQNVVTMLANDDVPQGADRAALHIDASLPMGGALWLDDVDLWQPE